MKNRKIIDIHTHVYPEKISNAAVVSLGRFYNFVPEGNGTFPELYSTSVDNGISGALMLATATNARQVEHVNDWIAALAREANENGFEAYAFGGYHQDCVDTEAVGAHATGMGIRGFKIHPDIQGVDIDDKRLLPLYAICEREKLPVYLHMGDDRPEYRFSEARKLVKILEKFPDLTVGAAHLGGYSAWDEASVLIGAPNVYYDTSSALWAITPEFAAEQIHKLGVDKVMFGTDYPVMLANHELERLHALGLTDEELDKICYFNAKKFLGI